MRVISRRPLRDFARKHAGSGGPLDAWWKVATSADWSSIRDVRKTYPHADAVTLKCGFVATVFNVGGNNCRLIAGISYKFRVIYVKYVLTHPEYNKNAWKEQLCRE